MRTRPRLHTVAPSVTVTAWHGLPPSINAGLRMWPHPPRLAPPVDSRLHRSHYGPDQ